ncbi:MAG: DUF992 domain-containing protein [Hyphomicrobium sp.]|nr:DUF992 domain-containing protein [Hyphomicrobium sp.]
MTVSQTSLRIQRLLAVLVLGIFAPAVHAQSDRALAGRLSCTAEAKEKAPASRESASKHEVSCTFEPSTGTASKFTGTIGQSGGQLPEESGGEKRVYIWLVHGPAGLSAEDLSGIFTRTEPPGANVRRGFEQALISANGAVSLLPPAGADQLPGNAALTILELTLSAVRV